MSDLHVTWSEYHQQIEQLALQIYQSRWQFNQIVCIARGGLRIGDIFSRLFQQPLAILSASSYGGENGRERGNIRFSDYLSMTQPHLNNKVLLVDDLVDSGASLQQAIVWLEIHHGGAITEIRTATLWYKGCSAITPDYYIKYLPESPWIHQPFDTYEHINWSILMTRPQASTCE